MDLNLKIEPFRAHPLVPGGNLQTVVGYYLPGPKALRPHRLLHVPLPDGDTLVVCENRGSAKTAFSRNVLFMHGLGGDAESPYMLRLAQLFVKRGWRVFRMNHRGAGAGKGLARQLYHSGRSDDISAVLAHLAREHPGEPTIAVGFSLSGNALLKLLGEQRHPIPETLVGAVAVSPPIELSRCAAALCRPRNRVYDWRFMKLLKQAIREREEAFPDFPRFSFSWRTTLCEFDEVCTAPLSNFASAQDYYTKCSAKQFLDGIRIPTVLLASDDDPFVPAETFAGVAGHEFLRVEITRSGGHMGFVAAQRTPLGDRRWMDYAVLTFAESLLKSGGCTPTRPGRVRKAGA